MLTQIKLKNVKRKMITDFKVKDYQRQVDQMVYELYGSTKEEIRIVEV